MAAARTIKITEREYRAFIAAYALYEAHHENDEPGDCNTAGEYREVQEDLRALGRVVDRWRAAGT